MVFSYLSKARGEGSVLEVCWPVDQECNGHFLDVFLPLEYMIFTDDESDLDFYGFNPCPGHEKASYYKELKPVNHISERIDEMKSRMGRYTAVHVRKTDKLDPIKAPWFVKTEDDEFFKFIDSQSYDNIFLAADCRDTQDLFRKRYGDRVFCSSKIVTSDDLRQTSLSYAVMDLFLCIWADVFFGTSKSGFTGFIESSRKRSNIKIL